MILFFLSHAGGSAKSYCSFKRFLPKELNVIPMELSGHFTRSDEPLLNDISSCVSDLLDRHSNSMAYDRYAVFGHSMGTVLAAELVRQSKLRGLATPEHIFLSGHCAPDEAVQCFPDALNATDEDIINFFRENNIASFPPIQDEELIKKLNTLLCNDVRMADSFHITADDVKFDCDITVFSALDDIMLKNTDMNGWKRFTNGSCDVIQFSGGHFYFNQHKEQICSIISRKLGYSLI